MKNLFLAATMVLAATANAADITKALEQAALLELTSNTGQECVFNIRVKGVAEWNVGACAKYQKLIPKLSNLDDLAAAADAKQIDTFEFNLVKVHMDNIRKVNAQLKVMFENQ